jgi:hypothetical protein
MKYVIIILTSEYLHNLILNYKEIIFMKTVYVVFIAKLDPEDNLYFDCEQLCDSLLAAEKFVSEKNVDDERVLLHSRKIVSDSLNIHHSVTHLVDRTLHNAFVIELMSVLE